MSKIKTAFFCSNCGYESVKWVGKCPACNEWNTFVEEVLDKGTKEQTWSGVGARKANKAIALQDVTALKEVRIVTKDAELNRVLGGGIVPGSIVLVGGEPGIGKSTLFLQHGLMMSEIKVLYISGEESEQQIKMRADRLKMENKNFYLLTETSIQAIFEEIKKLQPQMVIVDSIPVSYTHLTLPTIYSV